VHGNKVALKRLARRPLAMDIRYRVPKFGEDTDTKTFLNILCVVSVCNSAVPTHTGNIGVEPYCNHTS